MTNTTHPSTPALVLHKCDHCEAHFLLAPGFASSERINVLRRR